MRIEAARHVPAGAKSDKPGDIVITLRDPDRSEECTAKVKVSDGAMARRVQSALKSCRGLTLEQAGLKNL
jgi:hypothetical protein